MVDNQNAIPPASSEKYSVDSVSGNRVPDLSTAGAAHTKPSMTGAFAAGVLADGNPVYVPMIGAPLPSTVWVNPLAGDTVTVSYSTDGTNYTVWPSGAVTAYAKDSLLSGVTHIKFQRAGTGITSTYGVC